MNPKMFTPHAVVLAMLAAAIVPVTSAAQEARNEARAPGSPAAADTPRVNVPRVVAVPPLLLDPADLGFGATVVFTRVPSIAEIHDLEYLESVSHLVLQLPEWPADLDALQPLAQMALPEGADLIVVLPGYPETRAQVAAWNLLRRPVRIIMVVTGPPVDREMIFQMNSIRGLERVIADVARPARTGFERLQRPLAFRVIMP